MHSRFRPLLRPLVAGLWCGLTAGAGGLAAQHPADSLPARGTVSGTVVDASSGAPIGGALVALEAVADGAVALRPAASRFWSAGVTTLTDDAGEYRFAQVPPGHYRLLVRRLGYREGVLAIELRRAGGLRVSVGLVVVPIRLEPMNVEAPLASFGRRVADDRRASGRLDAEVFRQRSFVQGDARVLTHGDVVEAITLGEADLFRAFQRLPGVTTRDDFTAELWTRGAPWGLMRVYFDGLPLFNPLHTAGAFSAVNPDAVGGAFFLPGVRAPAIGEGAAGVLDIVSRPARSERWSGLAELSMVSARGAVDRRFADGRGGIAVAARRSYVDLVTRAAEVLGADSGTYVPYGFHDVTARAEMPLGTASVAEVSGLWEEDRVWGTVRGVLRDSDGRWGNVVGRASVLTPVGGVATRHTIGVSRFLGNVEFNPSDSVVPGDSAPTHARMDNRLTYVVVGSEVESGRGTLVDTWRAGLQVVMQRQSYDGPFPRPYPSAEPFDSLRIRAEDQRLTIWGEARQSLASGLVVHAGLRAEVGRALRNAGALAISPRVSARYTVPGGRVTLSAGYGRSYQYTQPVAPAGPGVGPDLHLTDVWLLATDSVPAIRSDVVTAGTEAWLGDGWIGAVHLYARNANGLTVPSPIPGVYTSTRPVFVEALNRARGIEVSARRIAGRWTASLAYSYGASKLDASGLVYPSPAERRHVADATLLYRITPSLRAGGAFTAGSGAPYTRFILTSFTCDSTGPCVPTTADTLQIESPGAERAPTYSTLDVLVEWGKAVGSLDVGVSLQVRNVLNRRNAVTYAGSVDECTQPPNDAAVVVRPGICDLFDRGLPVLPLVAVRVGF